MILSSWTTPGPHTGLVTTTQHRQDMLGTHTHTHMHVLHAYVCTYTHGQLSTFHKVSCNMSLQTLTVCKCSWVCKAQDDSDREECGLYIYGCLYWIHMESHRLNICSFSIKSSVSLCVTIVSFIYFFTSFILFWSCLAYIRICCSDDDDDQTDWLPYPHMHIPIHSHTGDENLTKPERQICSCECQDVYSCQGWDVPAENIHSQHTHTYTEN